MRQAIRPKSGWVHIESLTHLDMRVPVPYKDVAHQPFSLQSSGMADDSLLSRRIRMRCMGLSGSCLNACEQSVALSPG